MSNTQKPAVIVVDPVSTGAYVLHNLLQKYPDIIVVVVFSPDLSPAAKELQVPGLNTSAHHIIDAGALTLEETCKQLDQLHLNIITCCPLSEPGVLFSDKINNALGLDATSNDYALTLERRNKYLQTERIKAMNIPTTPQTLVTSYEQAVNWVMENPCDFFVIKPLDSAGSEGCFKFAKDDLQKLKSSFDATYGKVNKMGSVNEYLLLQHFVTGEEYVIDIVSLNGHHKLASCWKYAKCQLAQGDFVYLSMSIMNPHTNPQVIALFERTKEILDALGIRNQASHSELILSPDGSIIILEAGARPHGGQGSFLNIQSELLGYSLADIAVDAIYSSTVPERANELFYDKYPDLYPCPVNKIGTQIDLVNYNPTGMLVQYNQVAMNKIKNLPAFRTFEAMPEVNTILPTTVDCFTIAGSICFVGDETLPEQLALTRALEKELFIVDTTAQ